MDAQAQKRSNPRTRGSGLAIALTILISLVSFAPALHAADLWGWALPDMFKASFWSVPLTQAQFMPPDTTWLPLSLTSLAIGLGLAAFAYASSGILGARLSAWGKNQLRGVAKSAIIILFVFLAFSASTAQPTCGMKPTDNSWFNVLGPIQLSCAMNFAQTVRGTMVGEFFSMTTITALLSTVGNITPYFRPAGIIGISFSLAPAFRPIFDGLGIMLSMMSVAVGEWFVNAWVLAMIKSRMLSVFLPIGLFLRAWGLDKTGDLIIAIAIGFFFVYPFMLNINAFAMEQYLHAEFGKGIYQGIDGGVYGSLSECVSHQYASGIVPDSANCFWRLQLVAPVQYLVSFFKANGFVSLALFMVAQLITGSVAGTLAFSFLVGFTLTMLKAATFYVIVVSVIMPLFNLFITLTVIKELAHFMGTNIDLSAFEKLF